MKSEGNKLKAIVKLCFAAAVILALSTGFLRAVFFPKDVNEYESRMANQLPEFMAESFCGLLLSKRRGGCAVRPAPALYIFKKSL